MNWNNRQNYNPLGRSIVEPIVTTKNVIFIKFHCMISVIIPLYNAENTILAALDSVKNQEGNFDF